MQHKNIDIYYFTGTGNTLIVSVKLKEFLESKGITVNLFPLEKSNPADVNLDNTIGIAFPVAVFMTYPLVFDFIRSLPKTKGTNIFMMDTMAGFSLGLRSVVKSILKRKGYNTFAGIQIIMPDNFWPNEMKDRKNSVIIGKGLNKVEKFAGDILKDKSSWNSVPVLPWFVYWISMFIFSMNGFKKSVKFDKDKCIKCGLCAKLCPVLNIQMPGYPYLSDKCQLCVRCISFCPRGALYRKTPGAFVYRGVKAEELL